MLCNFYRRGVSGDRLFQPDDRYDSRIDMGVQIIHIIHHVFKFKVFVKNPSEDTANSIGGRDASVFRHLPTFDPIALLLVRPSKKMFENM